MADKKISDLTAATTPLVGTEVLPIVQSSSTKKVAVNDLTVKNVRSNATTGLLQIAGPTASTTRVMTTPDANFTVARTDASQTFAGSQNFSDFYLTGVTKKYYWYVDGSDNLRVVRYTTGGSYEAIPFEISVNSDVKLYSGNLVVGTSGKGIDFSANTGAAGMTSELLNWYEEGTWTPTVIGTSPAGTATYSTQLGTYTRIGRMVYFQLELNWNSGTGAGQLRLGGLPFTCGNSNCAVSIGDVENIALTALYYMAGAYVFANSTQISLRECQVGGGGNNPVTYDAAGIIRVGGCYFV